MASSNDSTSITFYVGVVNICLAVIWGLLYGFGWLDSRNIGKETTTVIFYVGTLFAAGFGIIFPFFEMTMPNKVKINKGLFFTVVSILLYGAYIAIHQIYGTLLLPFMK